LQSGQPDTTFAAELDGRERRIRAFQIVELYKNRTHIGFVLTKSLVSAHRRSLTSDNISYHDIFVRFPEAACGRTTTRTSHREFCSSVFFANDLANAAVPTHALPANSRFSVDTFTFSPSLMKRGTRISRPVSSLAVLVPPPEESPRIPGSV
jgi:hypothetical protein